MDGKKLNSAILNAFKNQFARYNNPNSWAPIIEKVETYLDNTAKDLEGKPLYHKAAKELLLSLWSSDQFGGNLAPSLSKLAKFEVERRSDARNGGIRFRDHIAHSANVFLLGLLLIDKCKPIIEAFQGDYIKAWMWCATLHDLGYPYENITNNDQKRAVNDKYVISTKQWKVLRRFFETNFAPEILTPKLKDALSTKSDTKHGLASAAIAVGVLSKNNFTSSNPLSDIDYKHAICAMAFHDEKYNQDLFKVHLKKNSLLYLLILCDELQCWNRPSKKTYPFIRADYVTIDIVRERIIVDIIYQTTEIDKKRALLKKSYKILRDKLDMGPLKLDLKLNGSKLDTYPDQSIPTEW